ncbi:MAG: glutaredoxin family protein [Gaiella sp.]|nr:glutaredoxin family protein [Gaiella sp.]
MGHRIVLYTAPGCHLCGPAVDAVRAVCGEAFEHVDITGDPELEQRYRTRIPVVEIDRVERFRYEVDRDALRDALRSRGAAADAPR